MNGCCKTSHLRIRNHIIGFKWWCYQMEIFSALLAVCEGNSPVTSKFPSQRPGTLSFGVFFDLRLNKRLSKQSRCWKFEMPSHPLWRHCNDMIIAGIILHRAPANKRQLYNVTSLAEPIHRMIFIDATLSLRVSVACTISVLKRMKRMQVCCYVNSGW